MKSILVVGTRGMPDVEGGREKHAERLFPLIASRGWRVCVAGIKPFVQARHFRDVSLWRAPSFGQPVIDRLLYPIATFIKAVRMRPDVVHFAGLESALFLCAYKLIGCKIVVRYAAECHAHPSSSAGNWAKQFARFQLRWADSIIAVTPALAKKLRASGLVNKMYVIGNALDREENFPTAANTLVGGDYILFVGQMSRRKNIHRLIAAFRVFSKSHPQMQLVIVGHWGKIKDRKKIAALLNEQIVILGSLPRSELAPLYRDARFFVNPSIREGHSNTLLEAISFRCPVLLSDLPENRDMRLNAKHYFDPGNIRSMVSAFHRAHANPEVFRVNADRFPQWEEIADRTLHVYENLFVDDRSRRPSKVAPSRA